MDPLCGWCYGFGPVVIRIRNEYKDILQAEVKVGGMIIGPRIAPVSEMSDYILQAYKTVEEYSGVKFGEPYLDIIRAGVETNNSETPCQAIYYFKDDHPQQGLDFAHATQRKLFRDGKSLNDTNTYKELAADFGLNSDNFVAGMQTEENRYHTFQEFQWVQSAGITGFPCLVLKKDKEFFLISRGFQPYEGIKEVLERALR
jgi:putative protein-disulfide isomerase